MLKTTNDKVVSSVKGKPVVPDAKTFERLRGIDALPDVGEDIRQGLDDVANGRTRPASEVFDEIRAEHGIPR